ncbi:TIGR02270 family protein [Variovorax sp. RKNM96]|uniref:TIGR02270 family protein n=1 Tax=Variovorax sp. RKNM96 TaxID=2681552 RepID=UPI0019811785|nr:TIGR02270 family protein [Variovorax sp. RKNM96]
MQDFAMWTTCAEPVIDVVQLHVEEAAILRSTRTRMVAAPHIGLHLLRRFDERIAAHLDGIAVAAGFGDHFIEAALEAPDAGPWFVATVVALESGNAARLDELLARCAGHRGAMSGVVSALGWVSPRRLRGMAIEFLGSGDPLRRELALAACGMHRADPGPWLDTILAEAAGHAHARAVRVAGLLGRTDLREPCLQALQAWQGWDRLHAARSALLLGDRDRSLKVLADIALAPGPCQRLAVALLFKALDVPQGRMVLQALTEDPSMVRIVIEAAGVLGDPLDVPSLIRLLAEPACARLAGEAFSLLTGVDLVDARLGGAQPPVDVQPQPRDDPEAPGDLDIAVDEDDDLPWPDPDKVAAWWQSNGHRFPAGRRFFMGESPNVANCERVLRHGLQRQRTAAAEHLGLLQPGTPLFPTRAPAWRQQRWLDAVGA